MQNRTEPLLPLLLDIEVDLEQDLQLRSLAKRFGASEFHFHRTFSETIGETPRKHIERLRLEKAAMQLAISNLPITELAFNLGFRNPETFSRRFNNAMGYSPSAYRRMAKAAQQQRVQSHDFHNSGEYFLSRASFTSLPNMHLLAVRHLGYYGALNASFGNDRNPWTDLATWAQGAGLPVEPIFMGIFYDDPTLTPQAQQRCDVCIPLQSKSDIHGPARYLEFSGGLHAIAQYAGTVDHLLQAFQGLADEIRRSARYTFREGAPLLFLRSANIGGQPGVHRFDACFPVSRQAG